MPALPAIRVHAFVALERELRRRGPGSLVRAAERAAALILDLDLSAEYPTEYLIFRVLGERTSLEGPVVDGEQTRALLCTLVERLTEHAGLSLDHALARDSLSQEELAARWNVSRKTLDRLRRQGLAAIRARHPKAHSVLRFPRAWVERFERTHGERLAKAAHFERIGTDQEARIVRRAARYQRVLGCSLNQAALRIAQRMGKSHEGIRQVLKRHLTPDEARVGERLAPGAPPLRARDRAMLARAWRLGVSMRTLSRRTRRSPAAIRRAIAMARHERVRAVAEQVMAPTPVPATFALPDAASVILAPAPVREGLVTQWPKDLAELLAMSRVRVVPHSNEETARALAMRFLVHRAQGTLAKVKAMHPSNLDLDQVEADLAWASRLRATLVRPYLTLVIETLEERLGAPLATLAPKDAIDAVSRALGAACGAVDHFDPAGRGRLAAAVGISVDRAALAWVKQRGTARAKREGAKDETQRATRILVPGFARIDAASLIHGAAHVLEAPQRLGAACDRIESAQEREMFERRYGLNGHVPTSVRDAGVAMGLKGLAAGRIAHAAELSALAAARKAAGSRCAGV